jgi:uncharacterized repeat protein (TIGR01451 family)
MEGMLSRSPTRVITVTTDGGVSTSTPPVVVKVCAVTGVVGQDPPVATGTGTPVGAGVTTPAATPIGTPVVSPNLRVVKTGPAAAIAGQLVTYRITVRNRGTGEARGVVLRDVLPKSFSVFGRVKGASVSKGAVRWNVGTLAPVDGPRLLVQSL